MNLVTQEEAAAILRRSIGTIYRLRREGLIPFVPGRPVMIDLADIEKLKITTKWPDTKNPLTSLPTRADIMKSAGLKTDGVTAFQRGQKTWLKRRRS